MQWFVECIKNNEKLNSLLRVAALAVLLNCSVLFVLRKGFCSRREVPSVVRSCGGSGIRGVPRYGAPLQYRPLLVSSADDGRSGPRGTGRRCCLTTADTRDEYAFFLLFFFFSSSSFFFNVRHFFSFPLFSFFLLFSFSPPPPSFILRR